MDLWTLAKPSLATVQHFPAQSGKHNGHDDPDRAIQRQLQRVINVVTKMRPPDVTGGHDLLLRAIKHYPLVACRPLVAYRDSVPSGVCIGMPHGRAGASGAIAKVPAEGSGEHSRGERLCDFVQILG